MLGLPSELDGAEVCPLVDGVLTMPLRIYRDYVVVLIGVILNFVEKILQLFQPVDDAMVDPNFLFVESSPRLKHVESDNPTLE